MKVIMASPSLESGFPALSLLGFLKTSRLEDEFHASEPLITQGQILIFPAHLSGRHPTSPKSRGKGHSMRDCDTRCYELKQSHTRLNWGCKACKASKSVLFIPVPEDHTAYVIRGTPVFQFQHNQPKESFSLHHTNVYAALPSLWCLQGRLTHTEHNSERAMNKGGGRKQIKEQLALAAHTHTMWLGVW